MFGRLGFDDLPVYSAVAAAAAGVVVAAGVAILVALTVTNRWLWLWREWLTTLNHRKIGIMYVIIALVMMLRAFLEAAMMRTQQALALNNGGFLPAEHYAQLFSTHGTTMIFFVLMPFMTGLINIVLPMQIGSRDMAFPWLNAIGLWLTAAGAALLMVSLVLGRFSTGGWTGYPSFTEAGFNPGTGPDYWIWTLTLSGIGSTFAGINFIATIWKHRTPGMALMAMPLFCWTSLCTGLLMVFAFPALTVATSLLWLDRTFGFHFFTNGDGGNVMQYVNLFWLWGHPEVYILILPAFGVFSEVISTFSSKRLFGYTSLVYATMTISVFSFTVWLHHFFTMGASAGTNAFFGIMTMIIAVPTGVKVYDWIFTMFRGRLRFDVPMLYATGFLVTFVIGGATGVLMAIPPVDWTVHNSVFLVAHFHNMVIPGSLFGMFAGYNYWFPKAMGFRLDETWGVRSFWFWIVGFYVAFMPLYLLGLMGMSRRMQQYSHPEWQIWLVVAWAGAVLVGFGVLSQVIQLWVSVRDRHKLEDVSGDAWNGRTLEWSIPSPPPDWNFARLPEVYGRDTFVERKLSGTAYAELQTGRYEDIEMPRNTGYGFLIGMASFAVAFGAVWWMWWLAALGFVAVWALLIARSFDAEPEHTITAATLHAYDRARVELLQRLMPGRSIADGVPIARDETW